MNYFIDAKMYKVQFRIVGKLSWLISNVLTKTPMIFLNEPLLKNKFEISIIIRSMAKRFKKTIFFY